MRKIPTLFARDPDDRAHVLTDVNSGCEWVLAGDGVATRKWDGTCVRIDSDQHVWTRHEIKPGKTPPNGFQEAEHDPVTGKTVGWVPGSQSSFTKMLTEALETAPTDAGTYELVGPKINGNPEGFAEHRLIPHGRLITDITDRSFEGLRDFLAEHRQWEGIVFWRDPGKPEAGMVKIKARDFDLTP